MKKIILLCIVFAWVGQTFAQSSDWFPPSAPPTGNQINDLDFVDDSTGWAVGYNGIILKTTDGGASWTTQKIGAGMIYYDAFFIDSSNGWVIGRIDLLGYVPLIYITTDGGESWRIRQTGASTALYSISFANHSEGWAVGCEIRKTTDGGESWTGQSSGATNCLKSVYFLDNQIGWIVGKGGNILKTTNGGDSWDVCASPTSEDLNSVYFVDGQRGCAVGNWGTIITTSDGGATWFNSETGLSNYLSSVTFFDALTGWAAGEDGLIIKTTDGGTTWKAQSSAISTDLKSIYFINSNTGWTAGAYGKILKTTNGGGEVTFTSPILQSPADESPDISINPTLYWNSVSGATSYRIQVSTISVFSSTVFDIDGITATSYQLNDLISDSTYYWRVAANYGEYGEGPIIWSTIWSFKTLTTPPFPPTLLLPEDREDAQPTTLILYWQEIYLAESYHLQVSTDPSFTTMVIDESDISDLFKQIGPLENSTTYYWHVSGKNVAGEGNYSETWYFKTCGTTWVTQLSGVSNDLGSVCFVSTSTGWSVGEHGIILTTTDGGTNWTAQTSGTSTDLESVHFVDPLTGWAVGTWGKVLHTTDGGINWTKQQTGIVWETLFAVYFVDSRIGWTVGEGGLIIKTTDGGTSWNSLTSGITNGLNSIYFVDANVGWSAGGDGTILKSTDGGTSWNSLTSGTSNYFKSVYFVDDLKGWAVGFGGIIFSTANGGITWIEQTSNTTMTLNSVYFINAYDGWTVGYRGIILKTTNSGETWSRSNSETIKKLNNINFADEQTGWIVGENGLILRTNQLSAPTLVWPEDGSTGISTNPTMSWNSIEGILSYRLQVSKYNSFYSPVFDQSDITSTSFDINGLDKNREYFWRVNADYTGGTSDWSSVWSFATAPYGPNPPYLTSPGDGAELQPISPVLRWSSSYQTDTYRLQLSTEITFNTLVFEDSTITDTEKQVGPLDCLTTYYWRVNAKNAGGTSDYSETRNFKTEAKDWHAQESKTTDWLQSVYFFDAQTGWVVGWGGILKTTDGGTSWNE